MVRKHVNLLAFGAASASPNYRYYSIFFSQELIFNIRSCGSNEHLSNFAFQDENHRTSPKDILILIMDSCFDFLRIWLVL